MGRLRHREGQQPTKVNQQWPPCLVGKGTWGLREVISGRKELDFWGFSPAPPDLDSLREPVVPHRGLDRYLDSLFDPVLFHGDAVRIGWGVCSQQAQYVYTKSHVPTG